MSAVETEVKPKEERARAALYNLAAALGASGFAEWALHTLSRALGELSEDELHKAAGRAGSTDPNHLQWSNEHAERAQAANTLRASVADEFRR